MSEKKKKNNWINEKYSIWFVVVVGVFVTSLIIANIISVKLTQIGSLVFPVGVVIFPISYIFGDILTEVYGYSRARRVIWLGFLCNLLAVISIKAAQVLPPASFWEGQDAFSLILGNTPRLLIASFIAYLLGEFTNSYVLARMKIITKGKWLWARTIGSTLLGQGLDSLVFISIAFFGMIPNSSLVSAVITQWLIKSTYETIITPVTYLVVNFLKRVEKVDYYDDETDFNPLKIGL
ncbi:queuosine precursor transporter [Chloroflexota bacterium]